MFIYRNRYPQTIVVAFAALVSTSLMMCQSRPPQFSNGNLPTGSALRALPPETPPDRVKELLLANVFTTCPGAGSISPTMFFLLEQYGHKELHEHRNAWTKLVSANLTEADRLNGVQYHGWLIVAGSAYRSFNGKSFEHSKLEWTPYRDTSDLRRLTNSLKDNYALIADAGSDGLEILKKNNQWSFQVSGAVIDPDTYVAHRMSCSAALSDSPFAPQK